MRFRVALDADTDQHGQAPVYRRAAVQIATDTQTGRRAHRAHVVHRADCVPARSVLVPRTDCRERHQAHMHAGVPQKRHVQAVHRVYRFRGVAVMRSATVAVRLPLSADIPQAEPDPPADRAICHAPFKGHVAEQPVAARQRRSSTGTFPKFRDHRAC